MTILDPEKTIALDRIADELHQVDPSVVEKALVHLVEHGPTALPYLRERLRQETDETARIALLRGIGNICFEYDVHDVRFSRFMVERLEREDLSLHERATLAKNLGKVGGAEAVEMLLEHADHEDTRVRANALEAFAFLAQRGREYGGDETVELLRLRQHDLQARVKVNATLALYFIFQRQQETCLAFLRELSRASDEGERVSAQAALDVFNLGKEAFTDRLASDSLFRTFLQYGLLHFPG